MRLFGAGKPGQPNGLNESTVSISAAKNMKTGTAPNMFFLGWDDDLVRFEVFQYLLYLDCQRVAWALHRHVDRFPEVQPNLVG